MNCSDSKLWGHRKHSNKTVKSTVKRSMLFLFCTARDKILKVHRKFIATLESWISNESPSRNAVFCHNTLLWIFHSSDCGVGKSATCTNITEYLRHVSWTYLTCPPCYYWLIIPAQCSTQLPSLPKHCSPTRGHLSSYQHEMLWNKNRILRTMKQINVVPVSLIKFIFTFPDLMHLLTSQSLYRGRENNSAKYEVQSKQEQLLSHKIFR